MISNHENAVLEHETHSKKQVASGDPLPVTDEETFFAKQRYKLHQSSPEEGVSIDILKNYFSRKYGF